MIVVYNSEQPEAHLCGVRVVADRVLPDARHLERRAAVHAVVVRHAHASRGRRHPLNFPLLALLGRSCFFL